MIRKLLISYLALNILGASWVYAEDYNPFNHMFMGTRDMFKGEDLAMLSAVGGLTVVSLFFDDKIYHHFEGDESSFLRTAGAPNQLFKGDHVSFLIGGAFLAYGLLNSREKEINAGQAQLESVMSYIIAVASLKFATFRNGPGGDSLKHAFPSGQEAFVTAGAMTGMYGFWYGLPFLAVGAMGVADYTVRRGHWMSDMIFGAGLGFVMGHAFTRHHQENAQENKTELTVYPHYSTDPVEGREVGVSLRLRY